MTDAPFGDITRRMNKQFLSVVLVGALGFSATAAADPVCFFLPDSVSKDAVRDFELRSGICIDEVSADFPAMQRRAVYRLEGVTDEAGRSLQAPSIVVELWETNDWCHVESKPVATIRYSQVDGLIPRD